MGLQVWMPMIGNINNQGLSNLSNLSGKYVQGTCSTFGKCLNVPNSSLISFTADGLVNAKKFSVCFWTLADKSTKTDWNQMLQLGDKKTDGSYGSNFRFESCTTYPCACSFHNNEIYAITGGSRILGSSNSTWYHVCVTYNGTELKSYTNGNLIGTDVGNGGYLTGYVQIGSANYFGLMNDLRIYDEVISQKQIRSIYNLQIIHYPLNNIYEVGITNKYFGDAAEGALNYDGNYITRTKLSNERGYKYKLSYTGTGKDMWKSLEIGSHFSFTAGRTYYYSCKVRCHSKSHTQLFLRAARCGNDWVTTMVDTLNADGQWHEYTVSQTINANFNRGDGIVTCNPWVEFYTNDMSTSGMSYTFDVDIKDIQVTEGQKYSFIANEMVTSSVSDISGYSNNASVGIGVQYSVSNTSLNILDDSVSVNDTTLSVQNASVTDTTLSLASNNASVGIGVQSPRYDACYYFSAKSYLKFPNPIYAKKTIYGLTINMWVRLDSGCGGYATILCMPERVVTVTPNVKYYIECTLTWNGFTSTNSGGTFDMWFQGTQNDGWTTGNPVADSLNNIKRPRDVVLSKITGVYTYKATFTSTSTSITKFGISMRSDYSNGTAWVTLSDILIVPEKYYIDLLSSNSVKTKFHNTYAIKGIQELYRQNKQQQKRIEYLELQLNNK